MANEDGSVWVTYNGELYNEPALRADCSARGHRYRTASRHRDAWSTSTRSTAPTSPAAQRDVRPGDLGPPPGPAGPGPRPDGPEAALLRRAPRRRPGLRLGAQGAAGPSRGRPSRSTWPAWRATSSMNMSRPPTRSGRGCASSRGRTSWSGRRGETTPDPVLAGPRAPARVATCPPFDEAAERFWDDFRDVGGAAPPLGRAARGVPLGRGRLVERRGGPGGARAGPERPDLLDRLRGPELRRERPRPRRRPAPGDRPPRADLLGRAGLRAACPRSRPGSTSRSATPRSCRPTC